MKPEMKVNKEAHAAIIDFHKLTQKQQTLIIRALPVCVNRHEADEPRLLFANNIRYHTIARGCEAKLVIRYEYNSKQHDLFLGSVIAYEEEELDGAIDFNYEFFALYYWGGFNMDWLSECICDVDVSFLNEKP